MEKRDKYAMVAIAICFSAIGFVVGYLIWGPIGTVTATAGPAVKPQANVYESNALPMAAIQEIPHTPIEAQAPLPPYRYVVTTQDGYVVVLSTGKTGEDMHTVTDIFVSALPPEEQARLAEGIFIYDEHALFRILEDYGS